MTIAIMILAAGSGSRFQSSQIREPVVHKLLARVNGKSLVVRAIELAGSVSSNSIYVVLGCESLQLIEHLRRVDLSEKWEPCVHQNWRDGLASSIAYGVEQLPQDTEAVLILLADQIAIKKSDLERLVDTYECNKATDTAALVCAAYQDSVGVPAIFSRCHFDELKKLSGDQGAKQILTRHPHHAVEMPSAAIDIDTQQDLDSYLKSTVI